MSNVDVCYLWGEQEGKPQRYVQHKSGPCFWRKYSFALFYHTFSLGFNFCCLIRLCCGRALCLLLSIFLNASNNRLVAFC